MEQKILFMSTAEFQIPEPVFIGSHSDTIFGTVAAIAVTT